MLHRGATSINKPRRRHERQGLGQTLTLAIPAATLQAGALLAVNFPQRLHRAFLVNAPSWW